MEGKENQTILGIAAKIFFKSYRFLTQKELDHVKENGPETYAKIEALAENKDNYWIITG